MPFRMRPGDPSRGDTPEDALARMIEAALNGETTVSDHGMVVSILRQGLDIIGSASKGANRVFFRGRIVPVVGKYEVLVSGSIELEFRKMGLAIKVFGNLPARTRIFSNSAGELYMQPNTDFRLATKSGAISQLYKAGEKWRINP
jgi:hypothetical protein